jgi:hypothetical protein
MRYAGRDGCIGFHTEAFVKLGATRQEIEEALGMAVYMGGGSSSMYASETCWMPKSRLENSLSSRKTWIDRDV